MSATSGTECSRTSQASMPDGLTIFSIVIAEAAGARLSSASAASAAAVEKPRHDFFSACGLASLIR